MIGSVDWVSTFVFVLIWQYNLDILIKGYQKRLWVALSVHAGLLMAVVILGVINMGGLNINVVVGLIGGLLGITTNRLTMKG